MNPAIRRAISILAHFSMVQNTTVTGEAKLRERIEKCNGAMSAPGALKYPGMICSSLLIFGNNRRLRSSSPGTMTWNEGSQMWREAHAEYHQVIPTQVRFNKECMCMMNQQPCIRLGKRSKEEADW